MNHYELAPEQNQFSHIFVDLTHKCNMACSNCYVPNRTIPDMDVNRLFDLAERLPNSVTFRLIGGEPTLREDLPEIIRRLKKLNHQTTLFTNGLLLAENDKVKALKEAGLDRLQLSMNGGTLDEVYQVTDRMKAASLKIKALENLIANEVVTSVGMIVVDETLSSPAIRTLIPLIENTYEKFGKRKNKSILIPSLRFRSIGRVGRYMDKEMPFSELVRIVRQNVTPSQLNFKTAMCGSDYFRTSDCLQTKSVITAYNSKVGPIYIKVTDWQVDDDGIIDAGSSTRGRITKNWTIAPFFEDIKVNEFGY